MTIKQYIVKAAAARITRLLEKRAAPNNPAYLTSNSINRTNLRVPGLLDDLKMLVARGTEGIPEYDPGHIQRGERGSLLDRLARLHDNHTKRQLIRRERLGSDLNRRYSNFVRNDVPKILNGTRTKAAQVDGNTLRRMVDAGALVTKRIKKPDSLLGIVDTLMSNRDSKAMRYILRANDGPRYRLAPRTSGAVSSVIKRLTKRAQATATQPTIPRQREQPNAQRAQELAPKRAQAYTNRVNRYTPRQILNRTPADAVTLPRPQYDAATNNVARLMDLRDRHYGNIEAQQALPKHIQRTAGQFDARWIQSPIQQLRHGATNALGRAGNGMSPYSLQTLQSVHHPTVLRDRQLVGERGAYLDDVKSRIP